MKPRSFFYRFSAVISTALPLVLVTSLAAQIKVGCLAPQSGNIATFGISGVRGAKMAVDEFNRVEGAKKIDLRIEDDESKAGQAVTIARKFITQDKVAAILGGLTSSETKEMAPLAQQAKIPLLTPTATNVDITQIGDYIFRSCFNDPFTGKVIARFALDHLKIKNAVILEDIKQDYSVGVAEAIRSYFTANGGKILKMIAYSAGDTDFRAQLTDLKATRPDVIFLPGFYTEVALILKQARQLGIKTTFVGSEGWDSPALYQIAGKAVNGNYFSTHFSAEDPDPKVQAFVQKYKALYKVTPDTLAALYYDGAGLLFDAIKRAGSSDPGKIRDALAATKDYKGVCGSITIDPERNATKPEVMLEIENEKVKMVERVVP
jgi:branched-chain amino acid transport system substrate-binding protein